MNKQQEALRLALEALEWMEDNEGLSFETEITAIKEALAEQDDPDLQDKDPELVEQHYKQVVDGVREMFDAKRKQPAQEPVAWKDEQGNVRMTLDAGEIQASVGYVYSVHGERIKNACIKSDIPNGTPLYTSPQPAQPWVSLTDEEMHECAGEYPWTPTGLKCCRAIEAKLKEKNHVL